VLAAVPYHRPVHGMNGEGSNSSNGNGSHGSTLKDHLEIAEAVTGATPLGPSGSGR
jgi:hypothetical protein